jgi:hypothetical protein
LVANLGSSPQTMLESPRASSEYQDFMSAA